MAGVVFGTLGDNLPAELKEDRIKMTAGMFLTAALANRWNDREISESAAREGLWVVPLSESYLTSGRARPGFVLDVGSSARIIDGTIAIATGAVERLTETAVVLDSGRHIDADLVVLATGFKNMRESARRIFGDAVADRCGDVWGFDDEGELRSIWRPSGHPGFWFTGGSLLQTRIFSRYLALQIAASLDGLLARLERGEFDLVARCCRTRHGLRTRLKTTVGVGALSCNRAVRSRRKSQCHTPPRSAMTSS